MRNFKKEQVNRHFESKIRKAEMSYRSLKITLLAFSSRAYPVRYSHSKLIIES